MVADHVALFLPTAEETSRLSRSTRLSTRPTPDFWVSRLSRPCGLVVAQYPLDWTGSRFFPVLVRICDLSAQTNSTDLLQVEAEVRTTSCCTGGLRHLY